MSNFSVNNMKNKITYLPKILKRFSESQRNYRLRVFFYRQNEIRHLKKKTLSPPDNFYKAITYKSLLPEQYSTE